MKKTLLALFMCCMCYTFSSCDEEDVAGLLGSFTVGVDQIENIPVHLDQTDGERMTYSFKNTLTINNKDTKDYINKIKNVQISKLTYKVINFSGDPLGEVDGAFMVADQISLQNAFVVKKAADDQIIYEITEVAELKRIADALKSGQKVNIIYSGSALCNDDDMDFIIEVTLVTRVTIDP